MGVFFSPLPQDLYKTAIEFLKLEKIELGGVRGNILGSMVTQIYDEVFELVKVFAECKYDPLDPGDSVSRGPRPDPRQTPRVWEAQGGGVLDGHVPKTCSRQFAHSDAAPNPASGLRVGVRVSIPPLCMPTYQVGVLIQLQSFDNDYASFETKIQDLDRRLATIFCQGFDGCSSIESCAKVGVGRGPPAWCVPATPGAGGGTGSHLGVTIWRRGAGPAGGLAQRLRAPWVTPVGFCRQRVRKERE